MHAVIGTALFSAAVATSAVDAGADPAPADSLRIGSPPSAFSLKRLDPLDELMRTEFVVTSPDAPSFLTGTSSLFVTRPATRLESVILGADRGAFSGFAIPLTHRLCRRVACVFDIDQSGAAGLIDMDQSSPRRAAAHPKLSNSVCRSECVWWRGGRLRSRTKGQTECGLQ